MIGMRHYRRRTAPGVPSSSALAGALDIYAEGERNEDVLRMLFGLSILRDATAEQVDAALDARVAEGRAGALDLRASFRGGLAPETILTLS